MIFVFIIDEYLFRKISVNVTYKKEKSNCFIEKFKNGIENGDQIGGGLSGIGERRIFPLSCLSPMANRNFSSFDELPKDCAANRFHCRKCEAL